MKPVFAVKEMGQTMPWPGASNVLTYATGMYLCVFVALPVTEKLYDWLGSDKNAAPQAGE